MSEAPHPQGVGFSRFTLIKEWKKKVYDKHWKYAGTHSNVSHNGSFIETFTRPDGSWHMMGFSGCGRCEWDANGDT